ncbi:non-specific serine/threonine protein kinase [Malassezia vespertilionis]|uniref:Protein kinase domain-containing protein n=1 Tax=Malassezia vespertilionis TaxID=2020962 RepID=A0A2N1JGF4_9BASI|nr:non-specific serine/threonine protein kinase [Malassezia vespertilionis]PKI85619.1 hypothetical protein MVES_000714 [Malassezia vespertilionis]WFD05427.1 non-specific serine/threonine protein kinase [Malassezia vespertilionis]
MTTSTPPAGASGSRLQPPAHTHSAVTPNTSETFRNVRPLQAAFTSNGLVSKRRRSALSDAAFGAGIPFGPQSVARTASYDTLRAASAPSKDIFPSHSSFMNARPLRVVVETALADRTNERKAQPATMPDTPMKPTFTMSEAASGAKTHRRGRSMGGPFPSRAPLFPTPDKQHAHGPRLAPTTAPRIRVLDENTAPWTAAPKSEVTRRCHSRSASERLSSGRALGSFLDEICSLSIPKPGDKHDVFESPASPSLAVARDAPTPLKNDAEPQDSPMPDAPQMLPVFSTAMASPPHGLRVLPTMDSPNNCFASPSRGGESSAQTPTAFSSTMRRSAVVMFNEVFETEQTPITPTRKAHGMKWYEAAHAHAPEVPFGGTAARKHKAQRPRHTEPVAALWTPPVRVPKNDAQSEPANGRYRMALKQSKFEEHYAVESILGHGEFSEVVKARDKATGHITAVKRMKRPFHGPKDRVRHLEEVDVLCLLKQHRAHQHSPFFGAEGVIDFLDAWEEEAHLYIQTELCPLGSLAFVLAEYGKQVGPLDEARVWKILAELAAALDYIHKCGVLHLDLKPANVLITEIGSLKVTDFGMATRWPRCTAREILAGARLDTHKFLPEGENGSDLSFNSPPSSPLPCAVASVAATSPAPWALPAADQQPQAFAFTAPHSQSEAFVFPERPRRRGNRQRKSSQVLLLEREGDREYIAPEVIFESKYGKPADIFSLGLILLEAACGVEIPDNGEPWHKLRCDDFSDVNLSLLSPALHSVITSMLASQPYMRPTASDLMELPALVAVREIMARGLKASELDQLPAFSAQTENGAPYPLPSSKYYAPPNQMTDASDRMVVRFRGALIQEDEMQFMTEVMHAADRPSEQASPDTSTSLMTEDAPDAPDCALGHPYRALLHEQEPCADYTSHGMEIDRIAPVG